jgi:Ca2+-binding RTX toxin-like protein
LRALEARLTPSITLNGDGGLMVRGTSEDDFIVVHYAEADDPSSGVLATVFGPSGQVRESAQYSGGSVGRITVSGKEGDDRLVNSTDLPGTLYGGGGDDLLKGGGADDWLQGDAGSDRFEFTPQRWVFTFASGAIQSYLVVGTHPSLGLDTVDEAAHQDADALSFREYVFGEPIYGEGVSVRLAAVDSQHVAEGLDVRLTSSSGIEVVHGSSRDDEILGNVRDNQLYGVGGFSRDSLNGLEGDDLLVGSGDRSTVYGFGIDHHVDLGDLGRDTVIDDIGGGDFDSGAILDFSAMPEGVAVDLATVGPQTVSPGRLELVLDSAASIGWVAGTRYDDVIRGNRLDNRLVGGEGDDVLEGRGGNDRLMGGRDDDTYVFSGTTDLGGDWVEEDGGVDTLDFRAFGHPITLDLNDEYQTVSAGYLDLRFSSLPRTDWECESVYGTAYEDAIRGNEKDNALYGYGGNDTLYGRDDDDSLYGGSGRDQLFGDAGRDRLDGGKDRARDELTGGAGRDTFVVHYTPGYDEQMGHDFVQGVDDIAPGET